MRTYTPTHTPESAVTHTHLTPESARMTQHQRVTLYTEQCVYTLLNIVLQEQSYLQYCQFQVHNREVLPAYTHRYQSVLRTHWCVCVCAHSLVCVCVCAHTLVCVCMRTLSGVCMRALSGVCVYARTLWCVCMRALSGVCVCVCVHTLVCVCMRTLSGVCMRALSGVCVYARTLWCVCMRALSGVWVGVYFVLMLITQGS